ncbi:MAG TPA: DUF4258 domain-containing protein [Pseudobdellovibrionaceae bacterium]|nr:DUF4258 domain-containing protein [Pseudobdellovibrionaceae bacterium]
MKVKFEGNVYQVVITEHAKDRMLLRGVTENDVLVILKSGKKVNKNMPHKFWIYKKMNRRSDNLICLSISLESPFLIVITTLVNWRPI